jgi:hypothetical protein
LPTAKSLKEILLPKKKTIELKGWVQIEQYPGAIEYQKYYLNSDKDGTMTSM